MNIYDIAKLARVSIATVSRVVNDSPKVSEKTKEKVRAVMAANDYIPNVFARGMSLNSMKTVGIICPSVSDHYMASAVAYLEKNLRNYGYDCILYCSGYEQEDKEISVQMILQKRIDALLLVGSCYAGDKEYGEDITYIKKASEEIFKQDFFGIPASLAVTGQLEAETFAMAFGDVYTFGPTFRAENSNTKTHMAEFWMVEPEMAFCDLDRLMDVEEDFF